jgi:hypothetical protein
MIAIQKEKKMMLFSRAMASFTNKEDTSRIYLSSVSGIWTQNRGRPIKVMSSEDSESSDEE